MKKILFLILVSLTFAINSFSWEKFFSVEGNCEISFPDKPYHVKQTIPIDQSKEFLNYDVYLSMADKDNSICMMIVANFPSKIDISAHKASLEGFLNGIVNHKNEKKLIYANFSDFNSLNALDFLLENQNRYFKGKVFIKENKLYLIAMEFNTNLNLDAIFEKYVTSFGLK